MRPKRNGRGSWRKLRPMKYITLALSLFVAGCSPSNSNSDSRAVEPAKSAQKADPPRQASRAKGGSDFSYPTAQPDGSPLTEKYCLKAGEERSNPFGNSKTCFMVACDRGDKASCDAAATFNGNLWPDGKPPEEGHEIEAILSSEFRTCFGPNAPLDAESYDCLDREYRRLDAVLTKEYRAALKRQPNEAAQQRLERDERRWWRSRFHHCKDEVGDLSGSTATVVNQNCEIEALAKRIMVLRSY